MKGVLRMILLVLIGIFAIIQFFQPERSNPPVRAEIAAPPAVMSVLRRACYDCHSNESAWPWYSYVNPAGWFVARHVNEGRENLNFSDWGTLNEQKRYHARKEMLEVLEEGEMPLKSYLLLHGDAALNSEDHGVLTRWLRDSGAE